jgi:hypothetical protein
VKVHHNEGLAIHIGSEPCIVGREVRDEVSVGGRTGQPLSRERTLIPGTDAVRRAEAPPAPQRIALPGSSASQHLLRGPTSRVRASSASAPHLPDADLGALLAGLPAHTQ